MDSRTKAELVVRGASQVVTCPWDQGPSRDQPNHVGALDNAAVAVAKGEIIWVGPDQDLEANVDLDQDTRVLDGSGCLVMPGMVDPHTHLVHAGDRADEFHLRNRGATYQEIAAAGGGILSTVRATREATEEELVALAMPRLRTMLSLGVTACEVKSGYGLTPDDELKMLRVVRRLAELQPIRLIPTFLGAHTVPMEYRDAREEYVDLVTDVMLPEVVEEGLAVACDVFCEAGAFTTEEARRILTEARDLGMGLHVHAEQFSRSGGARLAAELSALSADHLEAVTREDARALAKAGVVAVGLPGCNLFLDQAERMPARMLIEEGVRVALATDFNPGSSHTMSLQLITTLGCTRLKLTAEEAIAAVTCDAARAVGRRDLGTLRPGSAADLVAFPVPSYGHLPYHMTDLRARWVVIRGEQVYP